MWDFGLRFHFEESDVMPILINEELFSLQKKKKNEMY
jgi:hypothetical protein